MMVGNEHHTTGGEAVRQWISMADSIGLLTSDCTMCRPAKRPIVFLAAHLSRNQHATCSMRFLTTDLNTFFSGERDLFSDLAELDAQRMHGRGFEWHVL
jgi:hypothetical protein